MITANELTLHLLLLIGGYELAAGLAGLTKRIDWVEMVDEFERSRSLTFVTGFFIYMVGGILIMVHSIWTDLPAIIVSAIGWIALAEGLLIMIWPGPLLSLSRRLVRNQPAIAIATMLFGAALLLLGLTGRAAPTL